MGESFSFTQLKRKYKRRRETKPELFEDISACPYLQMGAFEGYDKRGNPIEIADVIVWRVHEYRKSRIRCR